MASLRLREGKLLDRRLLEDRLLEGKTLCVRQLEATEFRFPWVTNPYPKILV